MRTSESIVKISPALLAAQIEMTAAKKDAENPFFRSVYADLLSVINAVKGPLNNARLSFVQTVDFGPDVIFIETRLLHESGEWIASETPVFCKDSTNPQALGSGITYSKRYALQAICGLPTTDDDAEATTDRSQNNKPAPRPHQKKPDIDMESMRSESGRKFIAKFDSAYDAIKKMKINRTIDEKTEILITKIWEEEHNA